MACAHRLTVLIAVMFGGFVPPALEDLAHRRGHRAANPATTAFLSLFTDVRVHTLAFTAKGAELRVLDRSATRIDG